MEKRKTLDHSIFLRNSLGQCAKLLWKNSESPKMSARVPLVNPYKITLVDSTSFRSIANWKTLDHSCLQRDSLRCVLTFFDSPQIAYHECSPVTRSWPSIGSLPEGLKNLQYIRDMSPTQPYVNLTKRFGLNSRTAFFSRIFYHKSRTWSRIGTQNFLEMLSFVLVNSDHAIIEKNQETNKIFFD